MALGGRNGTINEGWSTRQVVESGQLKRDGLKPELRTHHHEATTSYA